MTQECYCPVCEQDAPLNHKVAFGEYGEPFMVCEGCFENRPEEVIEICEPQEKATS